MMTTLLVERRTLTEADLPMLKLWCDLVQEATDAQEEIERDGLTISQPSGRRQAHPALSIRDRARREAIKIAEMFGCTPRSREQAAKASGPDLFGDLPEVWDTFLHSGQ